MSGPTFTFAILGHNEEELLGNALRQALAAAERGDRVLFVDSASTDGPAGAHGIATASCRIIGISYAG